MNVTSTTKPDTPKSSTRKGGAPAGNLNSARTGSTLVRLPVGEPPKQLRRQQRNALAYRRDLEAAVSQAKGEISVADAHRISEAVAAEFHSAVCLWVLRSRFDQLTPAEIMSASGNVAKAKASRNAAVAALQLDAKVDPIDAMYASLRAAQAAKRVEAVPTVVSAPANVPSEAPDAKECEVNNG